MSLLVERINQPNSWPAATGWALPSLNCSTLPLRFLWFEFCAPEQHRHMRTFVCIHTCMCVITSLGRGLCLLKVLLMIFFLVT